MADKDDDYKYVGFKPEEMQDVRDFADRLKVKDGSELSPRGVFMKAFRQLKKQEFPESETE